MPYLDLSKKNNIAILGDSITFIGHYISIMKNHLDKKYKNNKTSFINLGKSGETLSGLCEKDRPTPRACLFDRLDSLSDVLYASDMIIFCYGMNDGIFEPYSDEHMNAYIKGVKQLCDILNRYNKSVIAVTPPPFDEKSYFINLSNQPAAKPGEPIYPIAYRGYDEVLKKYAKWLISQKGILPQDVIDIYTPMKNHIEAKRKNNSAYLYGDGIHPEMDGHRIMAKVIIKSLTGEDI